MVAAFGREAERPVQCVPRRSREAWERGNLKQQRLEPGLQLARSADLSADACPVANVREVVLGGLLL